MEITITRALTELKLSNSKINNAIAGANFVTAHKNSAAKVDGINTAAEFTQRAKSAKESITSLLNRRDAMKAAIVASNAVTKVTIGDQLLTVAEAIEKKASIEYKKTLLKKLQSQLDNSKATMNTQNDRVQIMLDQQIMALYANKDGKVDRVANEAAIKTLSDAYTNQHGFVILDPLKAQDLIDELKNEVEKFEAEVDFALSESNAITKIVVPD